MARMHDKDASIVEDCELSLAPAFGFLDSLVDNHPKYALALTDFCMLYSSLVIAVGDEQCISFCFSFLNKFMKLQLPSRDEMHILYAVLVRAGTCAELFHDQSIDILSKMSLANESIKERVVTGSLSQDEQIRTFNNEVIEKAGFSKSDVNLFKFIPENATEEEVDQCLGRFIALFDDDVYPQEKGDYIANITKSMIRYQTSSQILLLTATCINILIKELKDELPTPEIVTEYLSLCFSISSGEIFLEGEDSFEAQEAIKELIHDTMELNHGYMADIFSGLVAMSNGDKLNAILEEIKEYSIHNESVTKDDIKLISNAFYSFHPQMETPSFLEKPVQIDNTLDKMQESIQRLLNEETIFEEIDSIVSQSKDGNFDKYPSYLRPMLYTAWSYDEEDAHDIDIDALYNKMFA